MTKLSLFAGVMVVLLVSNPVYAQPAVPESLTGWQSVMEITLPEGQPGLTDFLLTPPLYGRSAKMDYSDLRLYDSASREVPYAIRHRSIRNEFQTRIAKEFNRIVNPDRSIEVSFDLGVAKEEHNRIEVISGGTNYRRAARLEGSDDTKSWRPIIGDGTLFFFKGEGQTFDRRALTYPTSRFRYLRLFVKADPGIPNDSPAPVQVAVVRVVRDSGLRANWTPTLSERVPSRATDGYASEWILSMPGEQKIPWESLEFQTDETAFVRPYRIEAVGDIRPGVVLAAGQWERAAGDKRPLRIEVNPAVVASQIRLIVVDQRNPPLTLKLITASSTADQILFERSVDMTGPLLLYVGNPNATAPGYDLNRTLPPNPLAQQRAVLGELIPNSIYRAPVQAVSFLDRKPWATTTAFGLIGGTLALVLVQMARRAVREQSKPHVMVSNKAQ